MRYLVDLGRLLKVPAVTPADAVSMAELLVGANCDGDADRPITLYVLDNEEITVGDESRHILRVIPCGDET